jgi:hypothetical protein
MGNQGTTTINFGAFPGTTDVTLAIADANIQASSIVEAWIMPAATADHSIDEHWLDPPKILAGNVQAGVGFTIYANAPDIWGGVASAAQPVPADCDNLFYGAWNVAWCWN